MTDPQRKSPSFAGLRPASASSSKAKKANKATDTKPEVLLRKALWRQGLRYRKNLRTLPGRPDIVFSKARVAIFCDGDFWHGREWSEQKAALSRGWNSNYWASKIARNIERDREVNEQLRLAGWLVLRYWESDLRSDLDVITSDIQNTLARRLGAFQHPQPRES